MTNTAPLDSQTPITSINQVLNDAGEWITYDLDDLVHQVASSLASNANNGGTSEQVEFLRTLGGWDDAAIIDALNEKR